MVRLIENKHFTEFKSIERLSLPSVVYIPLIQHIGKPCSPSVNVGDTVLAGQKIASSQAHIYANIHASLSGKVRAIKKCPHPLLGTCDAVVIDSDGLDSHAKPGIHSNGEVIKLSADEIRSIIFEAGIVGMGGAGFPTHIKLKPPKPVDTFILNAAECEPYLNCDYRLMVEKTKEILLGTELVLKCLGAKDVYIAIEENKPEAIKIFRDKLQETSYKLIVLKSEYPQGDEKQLIKKILNRQVPSGGLPFELGVVVHNLATVFAIYEAVYKHKPLYERVVTVTGSCLENPKNLLVRIGTPLKDLIDFCSPLKEKPQKVIVGGPMMGIAQYTDGVPVTKTTSGLILLNKKEVPIFLEDVCIRCGECVRNCPAGLEPCLISQAVEKENWELARAYSAADCIECGLCSYLCPAKRNLVQSIKYAKLRSR
jgi:electron transport complex protein RnfC